MNGLLTVKEAMAILSVSRVTIYNWIRNKKITAYKVGHSFRIKTIDIENLVERGKR